MPYHCVSVNLPRGEVKHGDEGTYSVSKHEKSTSEFSITMETTIALQKYGKKDFHQNQ